MIVTGFVLIGSGTYYNCRNELQTSYTATVVPIDFAGFTWNNSASLSLIQCVYAGSLDNSR